MAQASQTPLTISARIAAWRFFRDKACSLRRMLYSRAWMSEIGTFLCLAIFRMRMAAEDSCFVLAKRCRTVIFAPSGLVRVSSLLSWRRPLCCRARGPLGAWAAAAPQGCPLALAAEESWPLTLWGVAPPALRCLPLPLDQGTCMQDGRGTVRWSTRGRICTSCHCPSCSGRWSGSILARRPAFGCAGRPSRPSCPRLRFCSWCRPCPGEDRPRVRLSCDSRRGGPMARPAWRGRRGPWAW